MGSISLRTVFGIAKSPELQLNDDELHWLVAAHTGKDSLRELNYRELQTVVRVLGGMRDSARKARRGDAGNSGNAGNAETAAQRRKIYMLAQELGWDKPARINGMCRRMFKVDRVEWLGYKQCSDLIEALKGMVKRKEEKDGKDTRL